MSARSFDVLDNTLFDIIDAADDAGYVTFREPARWVRAEPGTKRDDVLRDLVERAFQRHDWFTLRLGQVKRWLKDIETCCVVEANGDWTVRLNLARLLLLPCLSPRDELNELRLFFESMKPFYAHHANHERPARVSVVNNRDKNGRVYGSFRCTFADTAIAVEASKALDAAAAASPVLSHCVRQIALSLQKMGPWSWSPLSEEALYGSYKGPWSQASAAKHLAKQHPA